MKECGAITVKFLNFRTPENFAVIRGMAIYRKDRSFCERNIFIQNEHFITLLLPMSFYTVGNKDLKIILLKLVFWMSRNIYFALKKILREKGFFSEMKILI